MLYASVNSCYSKEESSCWFKLNLVLVIVNIDLLYLILVNTNTLYIYKL